MKDYEDELEDFEEEELEGFEEEDEEYNDYKSIMIIRMSMMMTIMKTITLIMKKSEK
ncbi:hypothetical protein ACR9MH_01615 [Helicobacter pylori]